jgi:predicted nuclease with TOPRIM domain
MNYAIFRSEPIYTLNDLAQIGSHNKREKKAYNSNPDIKLELTKNNIELVPLDSKYVKGFHELTKEYRLEHDERMKTERDDRKRTYSQMLDRSKNVVGDELLFTASPGFFKNMNNKDIKKWANTCMEFVYQDLGYKKEQVLHATVHMDEKTPHIHCVVIPLVKKLDKRTNTERYTISKKQYIRDNKHLSELQDKYWERLTNKGFKLERGIKGSDVEHQDIKEYKKQSRILGKQLDSTNNMLENAITDLEKNMESNKSILFDKDHIRVSKETFESMNNVVKISKKLNELQPKLETTIKKAEVYVNNYESLQSKNYSLNNEISNLEKKNNELKEENMNLKHYIEFILDIVKEFFKKMLHIGNDKTKEDTANEVKEYYDNDYFDKSDVKYIVKNTTKEYELYNYIGYDKNKDDYEL